jgi:zinc protease
MVTERSPDYVADRELRRRLFGTHPAARLPEGTAAGLRTLKRDDLETWWKSYARPDAATLYIAGAIEPEAAFELARTHMTAWTAEGEKPTIALPAVPKPAKTKIYLVDRSSNQSQIRVGQHSVTRADAAYPTARVVTEYFGGGFNSRLNDTIRVKKGLTYGAGGGFRTGRFVGQFTVSTFSKTATVAQTVATILEEVDRLQNEPPSAAERDDSISYIVGSFAAGRETPQELIRELWRLELNDLPDSYYGDYLAAIRDVSPSAAVEAAKNLVDPESLVIIVVGPADKLKPALSQIADVEVVDPSAD